MSKFSDALYHLVNNPDNSIKVTNEQLNKDEYIYTSKGQLCRHTSYGEYPLDVQYLNKLLSMEGGFKVKDSELNEKNIQSAKGWLNQTINDKTLPENKPDKTKWF